MEDLDDAFLAEAAFIAQRLQRPNTLTSLYQSPHHHASRTTPRHLAFEALHDSSRHSKTPPTPVVRYGLSPQSNSISLKSSVSRGQTPSVTPNSTTSSRVYRAPRPQDDSSPDTSPNRDRTTTTGLITRATTRASLYNSILKSSPIISGSYIISLPSPIRTSISEAENGLKASVMAQAAALSCSLQQDWMRAEQDLIASLDKISIELTAKEERIKREDEAALAESRIELERKLSEVQGAHGEIATKHRQQVERLIKEEADRREAERLKEQRLAEQLDFEKNQQLGKNQQLELKAAEQRAAEESLEEERKAKAKEAEGLMSRPSLASTQLPPPSPSPAIAPPSSAPISSEKASAAARCMRATPEAVKWEKEAQSKLSLIEESVANILGDEGLKKQRREIEKKMTVHVQQISATLDQVAKKCEDVYHLIKSQQEGPWRDFAVLMFATKATRQSDLVAINNKAAFPIATVLVKVSTQFPSLMDCFVGLVHREVVVSIPLSFVPSPPPSGSSDAPSALTPAQYRRLMGYKEVDDPSVMGGRAFESTDEMLKRVEGLMLLYGAVVQTEDRSNPHGHDAGWRWLSRAINSLPADRVSAKAIVAFLRTGGFGLHLRYRGQFVKVLTCMHESFLPELIKCDEPDIQPLSTLLKHYLYDGQYGKEPEGRRMPKVDVSTFFDR